MSIDTTSPSRSEMTVATLASAPGRSGSSTRSRYLLIRDLSPARFPGRLGRGKRGETGGGPALAAVQTPAPPGPFPFSPRRDRLYTQAELTERTADGRTVDEVIGDWF